MSDHTSSQWLSNKTSVYVQSDDGFRTIASTNSPLLNRCVDTEHDWTEDYANAKRIAACVNACAGLPDASLDEPAQDIRLTLHATLVLQVERDHMREMLKRIETVLRNHPQANISNTTIHYALWQARNGLRISNA